MWNPVFDLIVAFPCDNKDTGVVLNALKGWGGMFVHGDDVTCEMDGHPHTLRTLRFTDESARALCTRRLETAIATSPIASRVVFENNQAKQWKPNPARGGVK
jgi:hypothetical protein